LVILVEKRKTIMSKYYIYMLSNPSRMLYVGLTTDIQKMLIKHREKRMSNFRANFSYEKLVYVEETSDIEYAIEREKTLKSVPSYFKMDLLKITNPKWECISKYWADKAIEGIKNGI